MKTILSLFILLICGYTSLAQSTTGSPAKPLVIGEVLQLHSSILSETRTLNIYLPEGYKANDTANYPVVYLLDGGTDEDFIHITGLYQFNSFPWINRVRPSIIVGITNTQRQRDMTHATTDTALKNKYPVAGHSDKFINFIEKELQPFVKKAYRTTAAATLIGESLGGLLAAEILLKKPALFSTYIIVSPSLWWDNASLLDQSSTVLDAGYNKPTNVYIGVGKEGLVPGKVPRVMEVDANLLADKIMSTKSKSVKAYFDYLPNEDHATIMHQAMFNALIWLSKMSGKK